MQHGAWQRWTGDPLHFICPEHNTLLWNEGPHRETLANDFPFRKAHALNWRPLLVEGVHLLGDLSNLQEQLRQARFKHPIIDVLMTKLIVAYRRAHDLNPKSRQLRKWCKEGWSELHSAGRKAKSKAQQQRCFPSESIWTRSEDLVSIAYEAVPASIAAATGDSRRYEEMFEDLYDLGLMKKIDTSCAANYRGAVVTGPRLPRDHLSDEATHDW